MEYGHVASQCTARADSLRQVWFAIWVERAWTEYISLSSGSVMNFEREISVGKCQIFGEMG
ncbi:hypothetical protein DVH24_039308 [Malus domestica]|uniref:Uncharacterized protein n=1 Tax=Malus domestica TaxID=3750 RepID=A0A498HYA3_MALDO|nr:hypothetical protein DVH24_039308 [Malus domestica]